MIETWPSNLKWEKLDSLVKGYKELLVPDVKTWVTIKEKPITAERIKELRKSGLDFFLRERVFEEGYFIPASRNCHKPMMIIKRSLTGYDRDVTLMHELIHALYEDGSNILYDASIKLPREVRLVNNAIVDWLARKARANPEILHAAIKIFEFAALELMPQVYDRASFEAFGMEANGQRVFTFMYGLNEPLIYQMESSKNL